MSGARPIRISEVAIRHASESGYVKVEVTDELAKACTLGEWNSPVGLRMLAAALLTAAESIEVQS